MFLLLFSRAMTRDLDLDEHQFVAPPLLLLHQHVHPFADYPYFHMPGLVYVYAALFHYLPYPLLTARLFSVVCGTATVLLLFLAGWRLVAQNGGNARTCWTIAGGLSATFLTSRLFTYTNGWAWNHDSAVLCAVIAFLCHVRGLSSGHLLPFVAAGFCVGLAIDFRLSLAVCFVPFVLSLAIAAMPVSRRLLALSGAALAALVACLPACIFLFEAPRAFLFGNLQYPQLNTRFYQQAGSGAMNLPGKAYHLAQTFVADPGNLVVLLLFFAAVVYLLRPRATKSPRAGEVYLLLGLVVALLIGSWGPTPTQYQYYYQMLPFLVLTIFYAAAGQPETSRHWIRGIGIAAIVAVATGLPRWYWPVIRIASPQRWTTFAVHDASLWLKDHTPPGGRVLTTDLAVPLEAGIAVYPEYAVGRHVLHVGSYLSPQERRTLQIAWGEELRRVLAERPADAVFVDRRVLGDSAALIEYARARGFQPIGSPDGGYELWVAPVVDVARQK
jgi:hypothetical protein